MKISETKLPARVKHALGEYGISTVDELAFMTPNELREIPNIGVKMIGVVNRFLSAYKKGIK